jgi:hypothetical protein
VTGRHTEDSTFAACVASIVGVPVADVPLGREDVRAWLAGRGAGLVPVDNPATFAWAGPWIAIRPRTDGEGVAAAVLFGVPSGPVHDPAQTSDERLEGFVVAPLDVATWSAPPRRDPGVGTVEAIVVATGATAAVRTVAEARLAAGAGVEGDRYAAGTGTFASGRPGSALTLVDADVLDELGGPDHRRNVVVRGMDLNALVGREFTIGDARCAGRRLCEPCAHLERLNRAPVLRALGHRGGLRADILGSGTVRLGDAVRAVG